MTRYRLKTVRLINFHNFTDAEIPVRGHLFLVGDNASGKTTVLDAVQWVLSGGQDLEFNAAASLWGKKEQGRTLRGAVLRYDSERGVLNLGRTITYAALELEAEKGDLLTLGMGAELAHPEAELRTWGFIQPGPLSDVKLLKSDNGSEPDPRPLTKEELRESLGAERVFFQPSRYKKLVAAKLTRGEEAFDRLTWFWKVSKAYKQMASETRDYSQLLRELLPEPDGAPFLQVAAGLSALAGIEDRLQALRAQTEFLQRLKLWTERVRAHREEVARYEYMLALRAKGSFAKELETAQAGLSLSQGELARTEKEQVRARERRRSLDAQLLDLQAKDREGLVTRRITVEQDLTNVRFAQDQAKKTSDAAAMDLARAGKLLAKARRDLSASLDKLVSALEEHRDAGKVVEELVSRLRAASQDSAPETAWTTIDVRPARQHALALQREQDSATREAHGTRLKVDSQLEEAGALLDRLEKTVDPLPDIPRYAECLHRLTERRLKFTPLYRILEKAEHTDEGLFRDLEAMLGERVLAAVVPEPEDAAEVARVVLRDFPGIPVVRTDLPAPAGAGWIEKVVAWDRLPIEAQGYLLRLCGEQGNGGLRLEGGGQAEHWGARIRVEPLAAPLMGARARQEAHRRRKEETKKSVAELRARKTELLGKEQSHQERSQRYAALLTLLSELREAERLKAERDCVDASKNEATARERQRAAREGFETHAARVETLSGELRGIRERLAAAGLDALESRLKSLEKERDEADSRQRALDERVGQLKNQQESLEKDIEELRVKLGEAEEQLEARAAALRAFVAPEHGYDLERYALETRQGRQFTSIANIQERRNEAMRAEAGTMADIKGEGGILHPQYGGLFGLTYAEDTNSIVERRGEPLERLLQNFSAQVAENEQLLDEGRRKLFEEVMLGDLARNLRSQIADLEETVKGVNQLLKQRVFGERTRYGIIVRVSPEHARFVAALKRLAAFDPASQEEFKAELSERLKALPQDGGPLPPAFDYRHWFEFQLKMTTHTEEGVVLEPKIARLGSGGEQAVPKYLIILAMASLLFRMSDSAIRVLLFDEVFYGVDQARREELLRLATELDLQLVVASPEQAGDHEAYRKATTVFLVKDSDNEVHMAVNHLWTDAPLELFGA